MSPPTIVRLMQLLLTATLLSAGFSQPVTQPTHEELRESIYSPMPYGFKYEAVGEDGGGHSRQESADGSGRVVGSYSIFTPEGLLRRVFYEADENGFRAHIETNEPGTKTSNPADVTIVSTAGGAAGQPLPNAATTRPVKTPSPAGGGATKPTPETTTGLPPGYVLPERYRPIASRRPAGAELLTSRILTLDQPADEELYPGRPGFESDLNPQGPPNSLRTGAPPSGIVPVGPAQISRVPGRPGGFRPRPHVNYAPSKSPFGTLDANHPSYEGSFRIPAGSSGGIFSPSQVAPKDALDRPGQDGRAPFGPQNPALDNAFRRGGSGAGQSRPLPVLGAPLFTRITPGAPRVPGRVDSQPSYPGSFQPGPPPGAFGVPAGGQARAPSIGPFGGVGGSAAGLPLGAPGAAGLGGSSRRDFGQPPLAGRQPLPPPATPGARPAFDAGNSEESSNEDGFAPNDPRRPFLFRNEPRPPAPGHGGGGTYAIHADNGEIQPGSRQFRGNSPRGFDAQGRPFRRPALGGTRRDDRFRPYKPPPIESGHPDPIFVPQSFPGPGSRPTQFDFGDPQRIDGFAPPHRSSNIGGRRTPGVSTRGFYPDQFSGGQRTPYTEQNDFVSGPKQSLTPFGRPGRVPPVPTIANVGSVPNPRNHFANRQFDRKPAGTFGRPAIHTPSLISMEIIRYGPHGPQVQHLDRSAVPGSLAPPENLEIGALPRPANFQPGSNQRHPLLANRPVPRPPRPFSGNVHRVLYGEAHQQPPFPRRLPEPTEGDFGSGFEGLIRDERPDLLELKPRPRPSGSVRPGDNLDFLEELLPFYEKDADVGKKGNDAAGGGERKPVEHEPIVPTHRELLCDDDDDPRLSDPRRPSVDEKPGCIRRRKPQGGGRNGPEGQNEPPVDDDAEFLNYRNPFSGVLPSPDRGTTEKVDRDGKNFRRPFVDKDGKVIPVLVDGSQPDSGELDGTVNVDRNKLSRNGNEAGLPDRPLAPELGAESPIEGRRGFSNDGAFRPNFGAVTGPFDGQKEFNSGSPGPVGGFDGPGDGQFRPFAPLPPRHQDGNLLNFQNIPRRNVNTGRNAQNPFRRGEGLPEESPFLPPPPQRTLQFGQRLSGARDQASLVPSQRPPRVQTGIQPQLTPQGQVVFPPPPLHRKAVLPGHSGSVSGLGGSQPFSPVQGPGASRHGATPAVGFGQPGGRDHGGGALGNAGVAPPRFDFVDSRRLGPGLGRSQGKSVGREDSSPGSEGQLISRGPAAGPFAPTFPASQGNAPKFFDENTPPATFTFSDTNKASLVPRRQTLGNGGRKGLKNGFDHSIKSGQLQGPGRGLSQERGDLLRKPLLETNGKINEELKGRVPSGVPGPFNFVDTRKPLEAARRRVGERRPQVFDAAARPGVGTASGEPGISGAHFGGIREAGFPGAPQELHKQLLPTGEPAGGAAEGPLLLVPQGQPLQAPQPVLLSVERSPVRRVPAIGDGSVAGRSSFGVQAIDGNAERTRDVASQELLRRGVDSTGPNEGAEGQEDGEQQRVNPYSFGYSSYDGLGSKVSRHESKDDSGRVTGYYVVEDVDGRKRTVHYVADKDGFRATVHTNEQGTENQDPAHVKMRVENRMPHPPPTPKTPAGALPATLADDVDAPVLDAVDQSVKKS